ncbi:MAG: thiamine diphosphokinase [Desulfobacter sp.]|nr:MAG: thiamine diphosphokinase [Desulfobacter sp.]
MKCIIAASGQLTPTREIRAQFSDADLIIAADGGASHLHRMKITPDIIIGDLDSISSDTLDFFSSARVPINTYPSKKDQTDTELCIEYAATKGCTQIVFLGVTGHRLDHTIANVLLLRRTADLGIDARIMDAHNEIYLVVSDLTLKGVPGDLLSVIPVSERVTGLTLEGLEYPLKNKTLEMGTALGVSNCFTGTRAHISIASGVLLVTKSRE